jgi:hypothetical protein
MRSLKPVGWLVCYFNCCINCRDYLALREEVSTVLNTVCYALLTSTSSLFHVQFLNTVCHEVLCFLGNENVDYCPLDYDAV